MTVATGASADETGASCMQRQAGSRGKQRARAGRKALIVLLTALVTATAMLASAGSAFAQEAAPSDIEVKGAVVGSTGDRRTIRLTVTNFGPGPADLRCGEFCDTSPAKGIEGSLQHGDGSPNTRVEVISTPPTGCREAEGIFTITYCTVGDYLAAGESRTLDFVVRVLPGTTRVAFGSGFGPRPEEQFNDPTTGNESGYIDVGATAGCRLTAKTPQKVANALRVQVRGGSTGCNAKVKTVKYKVGNKVFLNIRKKPQKAVAAGETWKLEFPINGAFKRTVKKALKAGKTVLGKVTVDLDSQSDEVVVKIK